MKTKKIISLLLATVMGASTMMTAAPAYAETNLAVSPVVSDDIAATTDAGEAMDTLAEGESIQDDTGLCEHHTEHTADCGYVEAKEGTPCNHVCSEDTGCVVINCVHEHDETCGYTEGDPDSCSHVCSEDTGCVGINCVHEHDENCGYQPEQEGHPCEYLCPECDCTCETRCENEDSDTTGCPVCAQNWQACTGAAPTLLAEEAFTLSWVPEEQYVPYGETASIRVTGALESTTATSASVSITLTEAQAALLTNVSEPFTWEDADPSDGTKQLKFTITEGVPFGQTLTARSAQEAELKITDDNVTVTYVPADASVPKRELTLNVLSFVPAQGTVTVTQKGQVPEVSVGYLNADGTAASPSETAPTFTIQYAIGDEKPVDLDAENLPFGLTEVPAISTEQEGNCWKASFSEELPVKIFVADGKGSGEEKTVTWTLTPGDLDGYTRQWIPANELGQYPGATAEGWYYLLPPVFEESVTVDETLANALVKTIYWADNNDSARSRPDNMAGHYRLAYALDGADVYTVLSEATMAPVGLTKVPQADTSDLGGGVWELKVKGGDLPSKITYTKADGTQVPHTVSWRLVPTDTVENYSMVEVTEENKDLYPSVGDQFGVYYVLKSTFNFTLKLNRGDTSLGNTLREEFFEQFYFTAQYTGGTQYFQLSDIGENITYTIPEGQDPEHPNLVNVTVSNLWRYNLDNSRMLYSVQEGVVENGTVDPSTRDEKMEMDSLTDGDYLAISYDNSAAPGYGNELTNVRDGGTINLTLTGIQDFNATKVWLDNNATDRPIAEMHLWRYRKGESYTTASVVRDADNQFVTLTLGEDTRIEGDDSRHAVTFADLPKYDPEGWPYIYVVREYLSGQNAALYEKVFGSITENDDGTTTITDTVEGQSDTTGALRAEGNTWLYDDGTLSNRKIGDVPATVTKTWESASFQSEFAGVEVQVALQSCRQGSENWQDTGIIYKMSEFYAENLTNSYTGEYPAYDEQGYPLEYRWVEDAVFQNGTEVPAVIDGDTRTFTLTQAGEQVTYRSVSTVNKENGTYHTYITNEIADTIYYQVTKEWGKDTTPGSCTFALYRSVSGGQMEKCLDFSVDGNTSTESKTMEDGTNVTITEDPAWTAKVDGLPEFDEKGRKYDYMILEVNGSPRSITTQMKGSNYESTVVNEVGIGNHSILIRKEWIDDSDIQHREPVTIRVYRKTDNSPIGEPIVLNNEAGWYTLVNINGYGPDDVYILETQVGATTVGTPDSPQAPTNDTRVEYSTTEHVYEATYSKGTYGNVSAFIVTNRRLGSVDITVNKTWADGSAEQREALQAALEGANLSLAIRLEFKGESNGYTITYTGFAANEGDTVSLGGTSVPIQNDTGEQAASIQALNLRQEDQTLYFWNLPKYDEGGASVRYTVSEVIVDATGAAVTDLSKYPAVQAAYRVYRLSFEEGPYEVGAKHAHDTQGFKLTNGLSDTKTVQWYCRWLDDYSYKAGNRPDIYLDVYATTHVLDENGNLVTKTELYRADYKWEYDDSASEENFWVCTLDGLPMYDALGYEIDYFATVDTMVDYSDFFYQPVRYGKDKDTEGDDVFADEKGLNDPNDTENQGKIQQLPDGSEDYALKSGNTFIFPIADSITYQGEKLWTNLPGSYPDTDLPKVTFTLDRQISGQTGTETEKNVASLTVDHDDWDTLRHKDNYSDSYVFTLKYEGVNTVDDTAGETPLPRFDREGRLYVYHLQETIDWTGTDAENENVEKIFSTTEVGATITNNYEKGNATLKVKKLLQLKENPDAYPAITMVLSRTYTKNNGETSTEEILKTLVWSAAEVKAAANKQTDDEPLKYIFEFMDLPVYAPNGSRYKYIVTEKKDELGGYNTWAAAGNLTVEGIQAEANKSQDEKKAVVGDLGPAGNIVATFLNAPDEEDTIVIHAEKVWQDLNDVFELRPDLGEISLTVQRIVGEQSGQGNPVGWKTVDIVDYDVKWSQVDGDPNKWHYTIIGLPRCSPNGMPYTYRVTETTGKVPIHYTVKYNGHVQTDNPVKVEGDDYYLKPFSNVMTTEAKYQKVWQDESGKALSNTALGDGSLQAEVVFQLQLRYKADDADPYASYSDWLDAGAYFHEVLSEEALVQSGLDTYVDTASIRGTFADKVWSKEYQFENLPSAIRDKNDIVYGLQYRVVETAVNLYWGTAKEPIFTQTYTANTAGDDTSYTVSPGPFQPVYPDNAASQSFKETKHINQLTNVNLTVQKKWVGGVPKASWSVNFLIQRSTDAVDWESVQVRTVTGTADTDTGSVEVTNLPRYSVTADEGVKSYYYRVVELKPGAPTDLKDIEPAHMVNDGEIYVDTGGDWLTRYNWNDDHDKVTVTNTKVTGLTISKAVTGHPPAQDTEFAFKIESENNLISGTYGDVTFENGKASFSLKAGESVTIQNLPTGIEYTVTETNNRDATSTSTKLTLVNSSGSTVTEGTSDSVKGELDGGTVISVLFTNTFDETTQVPVTKAWVDSGHESSRPSSITVKLLANGSPTGKTLTLSKDNDWKDSFTGLPKYDGEGKEIVYSVREQEPDNYKSQITGDASSGFTITNTYQSAGLRISKRVSGSLGDRNKSFTFVITLKDKDGKLLTGPYSYTGGTLPDVTGVQPPSNGQLVLANGQGTITLKHGQTITVTDLPIGCQYIVQERDAQGYTTTVAVGTASPTTKDNVSGTLAMAGVTSVAFVNSRESTPLTGIRLDEQPWLLALGLVLLGGAAIFLLRKRSRRTPRPAATGQGQTQQGADHDA